MKIFSALLIFPMLACGGTFDPDLDGIETGTGSEDGTGEETASGSESDASDSEDSDTESDSSSNDTSSTDTAETGDTGDTGGVMGDCFDEELWADSAQGTLGTDDNAFDVAVLGNQAYVVGYLADAAEGENIWVRRYEDGVPDWTRTHDATGDADRASGVAIDSSGAAIVTGSVIDDGPNPWIRKYDTLGNTVWTQTWNPLNHDVKRVAVDSGDNIIVVGAINDGGDPTAWVRKYTSNGAEIWTAEHPPAPGFSSSYSSIAIANDGSIFVAGIQSEVGEGNNALLTKFDSDGTEIWSTTYAGTFIPGYDEARAVLLGSDDEVIIVGNTSTDAQTRKVFVRTYNQGGGNLDHLEHMPFGDSVATATGAAVTETGEIVVGGYTNRAFLFRVVTGDVMCEQQWLPSLSGAQPWALASLGMGSFLVVGNGHEAQSTNDIWVQALAPVGP